MRRFSAPARLKADKARVGASENGIGKLNSPRVGDEGKRGRGLNGTKDYRKAARLRAQRLSVK